MGGQNTKFKSCRAPRNTSIARNGHEAEQIVPIERGFRGEELREGMETVGGEVKSI